MALEEFEQVAEEHASETATSSRTNVRLEAGAVDALKEHVGVRKNTDAAPVIEALIYEEVGDDEGREAALERFRERMGGDK